MYFSRQTSFPEPGPGHSWRLSFTLWHRRIINLSLCHRNPYFKMSIEKHINQKHQQLLTLSLMNSRLCPRGKPILHLEAPTLWCNQQASPSYTKPHSAIVTRSSFILRTRSSPVQTASLWGALGKWSCRQWHQAAEESSINTRPTRGHRDQAAVIKVSWLQTAEPRTTKTTRDSWLRGSKSESGCWSLVSQKHLKIKVTGKYRCGWSLYKICQHFYVSAALSIRSDQILCAGIFSLHK